MDEPANMWMAFWSNLCVMRAEDGKVIDAIHHERTHNAENILDLIRVPMAWNLLGSHAGIRLWGGVIE